MLVNNNLDVDEPEISLHDKKPELIYALHSISFYSKYNSVQ
jgi:hypothetical protein